MKTFGRLFTKQHKGRLHWAIECVPHVRMRLKSVIGKVDKFEFSELLISVTPETSRDLEWFVDRYPLEMAGDVRVLLQNGSRQHVDHLDLLQTVFQSGYKPRHFPLAKPLRVYQATALEVYLRTKGLLVSDALGLGKTVTAIGSFTVPEALPALVVCPVHLAKQWRNFMGEFMPMATTHIVKQTRLYEIPAVDVVIISYSKLAAWADVFGSTDRFKSVVFDEVQELRHDGTAKYKAACAIRANCVFTLGLSATPIYNYGGEIYNILEIVAPGRIGSRDEFQREWCSYRGNGRYLIKEPEVFGSYLREEFLMVRRRREEVGLELPQVQRSTVNIPHDQDVLEKIQSSATELARIVLEGEFLQSGEAAREFDARLRQATGIAKAPAVADFVRILVENGEKVLLFGWHREVYSVWMERLKDLNPVLYTGSESIGQKEESVRRFMTSPEKNAWSAAQVMIMSLRSGIGVDGLQKVCSTCVFGELDWSPGVHEQCVGRLNRDGLEGGVLVYHLVTDAGSDPTVAAVLGLKREQATGIIDPDQAGQPAIVQSDTGRVKRLAQDWLARRQNALRVNQTEAVLG